MQIRLVPKPPNLPHLLPKSLFYFQDWTCSIIWTSVHDDKPWPAKAQCSSSMYHIEGFKNTGQVVSVLLLLMLFWRWGNWVPEKSNTLSLVETKTSHPGARIVARRLLLISSWSLSGSSCGQLSFSMCRSCALLLCVLVLSFSFVWVLYLHICIPTSILCTAESLYVWQTLNPPVRRHYLLC